MAFHKSGHPESNSEYGKSLSRIAKEVDRLVMDDSGMNHFRDCIRLFGKRWNDHISDLERERQKRKQHWEKVKLNPKWQNKNAGPPKKNWEWDLFYLGDSSLSETVIVDGEVRHRGPEYEMPASLGRKYVTAVKKKYIQRKKKENKQRNSNDLESTISHQEGQIAKIQSQLKELSAEQIETARIETDWGWWRYLDMSEEKVFGCWRPPIKIREDPFSRLKPGFDRLTGEVEGLPEPKNKAEEYERYYVYLTSIHDNMLAGCGKINNDIWPEQLAEQVWGLFKWDGRYGPDIPSIEAALERVKADPAKKSAGTGQSQQAETPSEIKLMEQIAEHLKIWFQEDSGDKNYPSGTVDLRLRNSISLKVELVSFDKVLTWLRVNDHKEIARSLEQERERFLSHLQAVEQAIERGDNPPLELIELRSKITGLIGPLEHAVKAFTEKFAAENSADAGQIQPAETPSEIELMEQIAQKLKTWADQNKKLIRNFRASLTGPLPPMDYERVVVYLQLNSPNMAGFVQRHYEEVISCAKKIDTLTSDSSRSALETANSLVGKLRFLANRLAQTLEVAVRHLTDEKPAETKQKIEASDTPVIKEAKEKAKSQSTPVKLPEFIQQYCEGQYGDARAGSIAAILRKAAKGNPKINLPPPINIDTWRTGRALYYKPNELRKRWPKYKKQLPQLPDLKPNK